MSLYAENILNQVRSKLDPRALLKRIGYRTDTIQEAGGVVRCFCPIHKEVVFRTLGIDVKTGRYRCTYSLCGGAKGGDLIDLYARGRGIEYDEAVAMLVAELNLDVELPPTAASLDKSLEMVGDLLSKGLFDQAEKHLEKVRSVQPDRLEVWRGLAQLYEKKGDGARRLEAQRRLASLLAAASQFREALALCDGILEREPDDETALEVSARCHLAANDPPKALESFMRLADLFERKGQFDRAVEAYRAIEKIDLDVIDVYPHILNAMAACDRTDEALSETLEKITGFIAGGEWDRALECVRYVFNLDKQRDDMRRRFIELSIEAGLSEPRLENALDVLEELVERQALNDAADMRDLLVKASPSHPRLMKLAALIHEARGEEEAAAESRIAMVDELVKAGAEVQARSVLEELRADHPNSLPILSRLARMYRNTGETANAIAAFKSIVGALKSQAAPGGENGRLDEILPILQTICDMAPEDMEAQSEFIRMALSAEQAQRAVEHLETLLRRLEEQRRFDQILVLIERHGVLLPNQGAVLAMKARCLDGLERPDDARDALIAACHAYASAGDNHAALELVRGHTQRHPGDTVALEAIAELKRKFRSAPSAAGAIHRALVKNIDSGSEAAVLESLPPFFEAAPKDAESLEALLPRLTGRRMRQAAALVCDRLVDIFTARGATAKALEYAAVALGNAPDQTRVLERTMDVARASRRFGPVAASLLEWARIQEDADKTQIALDVFERQLRELPDDNDLRGQFLIFLAEGKLNPELEQRALDVAGDWARSRNAAEAERFCRQRLAEDADNALWSEIVLAILRATGQEEAAREHCLALAQLLAQQHQWLKAVDLLAAFLQRDADNAAARQQIIVALRALQRIPEAGAHSLRLAEILGREGRHSQAEPVLRRAVDMAPNDAPVHAALAACFQAQGAAKDEIKTRWRLADLLERDGTTERAIAEMRRILEIEPNHSDARRRLEALEARQQAIEQAVEKCESAAHTHHEGGDLDSEAAVYREAVDLKPGDLRLRRRLAQTYFDAGAPAQALDQLEEVARRQFAQADYRAALATVEEILAVDGSRIQTRKLRAESLARLGEDRRALEEFLKISNDLRSSGAAAETRDEDPLEGALQLVEEYSFDHFVVGSPNNFAYATAMAVARAPAQQYNPLFLYSDVGLGKTHLVNAIANYLSASQPDMKIVYCSADDFASRLVEAISNNRVRTFRNRFRNAGALLIDDIQFLAGKERAQDEFFNLFNALYQAKKQIVITSDRPPKDLALLEKRLRSRFGAGVVVDIQPPDQETREAILMRDRAAQGLEGKIPDEVIQEIARRVDTNIRELKAAFRQTLAMADVTGKPVTAESAKQILDRLRGEG